MGDEQPWWRDAVGYEVYIRSFADSNGDGIGDLRGLLNRLDHLAWLGVDICWITPFYPSPQADFGYDVADYCDVDPVYGTLDDFDAVVARAHELGLRIVVDQVPNHSSDQHPWFRQARSSPDDPRRDWYLWRDPAPDGGPPNNWVSHFGGPAWSLDEASGQYYCHLFLPEQPDLNWRNPEVRDAFDDIFRFWLDRGVDGFRIDTAHLMMKHPDLPSNPQLAPVDASASHIEQWLSLDHRFDSVQPENHEIYRRWNAITSAYESMLIGETYVFDADQWNDLLGPEHELDLGFWFLSMWMPWDADAVRRVLEGPRPPGRSRAGWVLSSHDQHRPATRFGGGESGRRRALALSTLWLGLPGVPFLYQGEELALEDGIVPTEAKADPVGFADDPTSGRDGCRTPMPWEPGVAQGFSTTVDCWLPPGHTDADTVAAQRADEGSFLHRYRQLLAVRRGLTGLAEADMVIDQDGSVITVQRDDVAFVVNMGPDPVPCRGAILYRTDPDGSADVIAADEAMIIRMSSRFRSPAGRSPRRG